MQICYYCGMPNKIQEEAFKVREEKAKKLKLQIVVKTMDVENNLYLFVKVKRNQFFCVRITPDGKVGKHYLNEDEMESLQKHFN